MQSDENNAPQYARSYDKNLPEITFKGVILAIILTIVLAAANAYLGLKVGLTVSASIPAAVISMGVLRFFRHSNVLENNIVQTAASAGEALTAGIAFTLPALIVIHYWTHFHYLTSMGIALIGGILGVLFSVPLRRVLLADSTLRFPEGTAIGKVLSASNDKSMGLKELLGGGFFGAMISLAQTGFKLLSDSWQYWFKAGTTVIGGGLGFAPAMIGAGYIIGIGVGASIFLGVFLGWLIGVPLLTHYYGVPAGLTAPGDIAVAIWKNHVRYIGIGTMIVGGLAAVFTLFKPMVRGITASIKSVKLMKLEGASEVPRVERDMNIITVAWCVLLAIVPIYCMFNYFSGLPVLGLPLILQKVVTLVAIFLVLSLGFVLASICAYFAGLVGSSANPLSSMSLISLIIGSFILSILLDSHLHLSVAGAHSVAAAALAIIMTAFIASIAAISNDTIQDLKAGQMVGATPWKQQVMLILGVVVAALIIPLILSLLFNAYGLGGVMPHPGMDPSQMLSAPQAGLMATVVQGIFTHDVQWSMMFIGGIIALIVLYLDAQAMKKGMRVPVLAVGIGIYLPIDTTMPLVIGALLSWFVDRQMKKRLKDNSEHLHRVHQRGLLLASGLVAGSAVMGVIVAIPFVIAGSSNVLSLVPSSFVPYTSLASMVVTAVLCFWFYRKMMKPLAES